MSTVRALSTIWFVVPVLLWKFGLELVKIAEIVWEPTERSERLIEACPPESTSCGAPMSVPLSWNWMLPAAVAVLGASAVVVALNVTAAPNSEGSGVEETLVLVLAGVTTCRPPTRVGPPDE